MLEVTALHLATPLFRATFMAILIVILLYIAKFLVDGYRYTRDKALLVLITMLLLIAVGAAANVGFSLYGYYLITRLGLEVDGLSYHYIGNIVYSIFQMCGFLTVIVFNFLSRWEGEGMELAMPLAMLGVLYSVEVVINAVVLAELILILANVAMSSPSRAIVGRYMVLIGLTLIATSRLLSLFPFVPVTDVFSSMMEVAGFSSLIVLRQDVSLLVKAGAGEAIEV